jgi:SAM-dependent methyltransferase
VSRFQAIARRDGLAAASIRAARKIGPYALRWIPSDAGPGVEEEHRRERSFRLDRLLACPDCAAGKLKLEPNRVRCNRCGSDFVRRRGTPCFAPPGSQVLSRFGATFFTHPYSEDSLALIEHYSDGVVLDFGAGNPRPESLRPHVLLHEAVQYDQIDVVSLTPRLPYHDNSFDAILSQAVFEHIPRPWEVASELHRVLKRGGQIHIDTAFLQPFHSDPNHYFNMTLAGVREIFRPFRKVRVGVKPYQLPSFGLRMQLAVMLEHLGPGAWRDRVQALHEELERDGSALDAALDPDGQRYLAAGVYFHGDK